MRRLLFVLPLFITVVSAAQSSLPNEFTIGSYLEMLPGDSLKVYYNCGGTLSSKACADFYRVGKIDPVAINVTGTFFDYYLNGNIFLKATMLQNMLEGEATYYHPNGKIKEQGNYKKGVREGKWSYFYDNGSPEKILQFAKGEPRVVEFYTKGGKALVSNGSGNYITLYNTPNNCTPFEVYGEVKDGLKHGKWYLKNLHAAKAITEENYEDGRFISGLSGTRTYTNSPKVGWTRMYGAENVVLLENHIGCPGTTVRDWEYNGADIFESFYPTLTSNLNKYKSPLPDQWLVVGVQISKKNQLEAVNVFSSINDTAFETYLHDQIKSMNNWKTTIVNSRPVESHLYFSVLVLNQQVIIPTYFLYEERAKRYRKSAEGQ